MNKSNKLCVVIAAFAACTCAVIPAFSADSVVFGPIDSIDIDRSAVVVLGQRFEIKRSPSDAFSRTLQKVAPGALVIAKGESRQDGTLVLKSLTSQKAAYVPGATSVYLHGIVTSIDELTGEMMVGSLRVHTAQASANGSQTFQVGNSVEILGFQPLPGGMLWATQIQTSPAKSALGIEGTGRGALGIEGTGKSIQGIEGTGKTAQGIEGTGKSVQGIEGTGKSIQGIEGTGKSVQGIEGTGKSVQGIEGTGKSIQGIEGTGKTVQGIEGTGKSIQGIEGTGKTVQGIEGTGRSIQGIEGTGKSI